MRVFVQIDDVPLFTVGGPHLITEILGLCGGVNVFEDSGAQALPVDLESVLARSPEAILSTDAGDPVPYWARFPELTAVARGNVYRSKGDLLARPSPRIAEGAADVCERLDEARGKLADRAASLSRRAPPPRRSCFHSTSLPLSWRASTRASTNRRSERRLRY